MFVGVGNVQDADFIVPNDATDSDLADIIAKAVVAADTNLQRYDYGDIIGRRQ